MILLACDIGSTNLKLQVFSTSEGEAPQPFSEIRFVNHGQSWLKTERPLETLSRWLSEIKELIVKDYGNQVDAMGFSTFREGLIGLSSTGQIVFAGNNLGPMPLGNLEDVSVITTFAGWMCWKLTGQCCITAGQLDAGSTYIKRLSASTPCWARIIGAGEDIASASSPFSVYLGGTDEQLGYVGTDLFDPTGPQMVIATGTFWSTSHIAAGPPVKGLRRTEGVRPFLSVDSCVLYKWGPMTEAMARGSRNELNSEPVPARYFGRASSLWFSDRESVAATRRAAIDDLRSACHKLMPTRGIQATVYGGGVRSPYARNLIQEACEEVRLTFMDGDATLRGCAIIGKEVHGAN